MSSVLRNHSFHMYNRPAAGCACIIVGMDFTIDSCIRGHHVSKEICTAEVGEELACQLRNHSFHMYNRPAAGCACIIVGMDFTIDSCIRGHHVSKEICTAEVGEELACQHEDGNHDVYAVTVKTNNVCHLLRKIGSLFSVSALEWYDRPKLAHGSVKFPARSISHFAMNIIMAKTFSTAKLNSAKCHNFSNPPKYLPAKISGHTVCGTLHNFCLA